MKNTRQKYPQKYNNYNKTSEAHKYAPSYDYPRVKRPTKKIKVEKYVTVERNVKTYSLKFFITLGILATFIISIVFIEAFTIQQRFEIDLLNANLKEINDNNKYLETELTKTLDLKYIEQIASTELDMQKPSPHQIVYISVPKESYSKKGNITAETTFIEKLKLLFNW